MVSAFSGPLAVHVSVVTLSLCFSRTIRASTVLPSQDFCWASRIQLTSVLGAGLISRVNSTNHSPRSRNGASGGNLVPMGGTTPDLPPVDQTPHLTLT